MTSDTGLLPCRELNERFGLMAMAEDICRYTRTGANVQHSMTGQLGSPCIAG